MHHSHLSTKTERWREEVQNSCSTLSLKKLQTDNEADGVICLSLHNKSCCSCALLSALQPASLLSSVTLACLPITIPAEDNMAPLASEKWPMCHHLIFAATATTTIITAIIVTKKQHLHVPEQPTTPHKQYLCICTLPATAIIITDLESVVIFSPTTLTDI